MPPVVASQDGIIGDGLKENVERVRDLGHYEVAKVYVDQGGKWYKAES